MSRGGPGSVDQYQGELFGGDPATAGLPRPIGWRVRMPDGSAAYDKTGPADTDWTAVGAGGGGGGTLAATYTAGLASADVDNRFSGPSYDEMFPLGGADQFGNGLFEHADVSAADPRAPGYLTKRYYPIALTIGASVFDASVAYDPTWDGVDLGAINSFSFRQLAAAFTKTATDTWAFGADPVQLAWRDIVMNSSGGIYANPTFTDAGIRAASDTLLYNSFDAYPRRVQRITGWGQLEGELISTRPGILPQFSTWVRNDARGGDHVGDGTGWWISEGGLEGGSTVGLLDYAIASIDGGGNNRWAWDFWTINTAGALQPMMTVGPDAVNFNSTPTVDGVPIGTGLPGPPGPPGSPASSITGLDFGLVSDVPTLEETPAEFVTFVNGIKAGETSDADFPLLYITPGYSGIFAGPTDFIDIGTTTGDANFEVFPANFSMNANALIAIESNAALTMTAAGSLSISAVGLGQVNICEPTDELGFFGASAVVQQVGGPAVAGLLYTATEQGMINSIYSALQAYGLLT